MARMHYRKSRQAAVKTRIGIAAAVLAGSGSMAAVAIAATNHGAVTVARPAAYAARFGNEGTTLSSVLNEWGQSTRSTQAAYSALAGLTQARQFSQAAHGGQTLDVQRGIVVLATRKFIILQSARGSLHLWLLSAGTHFRNVSDTTAGTAALTASSSATQQAMSSGNMIPATTLLAGSPLVAAALLTPTPAAQTVSVHVANTNLTVTVTVTRSMATIAQTATTPLNAMPTSSPVTFIQDAWQATHSLARGDLAVVAGSRSHGTLHAKLVLFTPLSTATVGGRAAAPRAASTPTTTPTSW
jgi:hypothetical protein